MSQKWNTVIMSGENDAELATWVIGELESVGLRGVRSDMDTGYTMVWVAGYSVPELERADNNISYWLIDTLKRAPVNPEWAVVTHGNDTEDGGRAWVLRNHNGFMDLIDIILGQPNLFGVDVERLLQESHGIDVSIWVPSEPKEEAVSVATIGGSIGRQSVREESVDAALEHYPLFQTTGTLQDPMSETKPSNRASVDNPVEEVREIVFDEEEFAFYRTQVLNRVEKKEVVEELLESHFVPDENRFSGTWSEYTDVIRRPIQAYLTQIGTDELDERGAANKLQKQSALDWHKE